MRRLFSTTTHSNPDPLRCRLPPRIVLEWVGHDDPGTHAR